MADKKEICSCYHVTKSDIKEAVKNGAVSQKGNEGRKGLWQVQEENQETDQKNPEFRRLNRHCPCRSSGRLYNSKINLSLR